MSPHLKLGWCWNAIANYLISFQASPVYIAQRGVKSSDRLTLAMY